MLDQSFSYENFRIILDVENRKGNYLEDSSFFKNSDLFKKSRNIMNDIIEVNKLIGEEFSKLPMKHLRKESDYARIKELEVQKNDLKKEREIKLEEILREISNIVNCDEYKILIKKGMIKSNSQLYVYEDKPENYFVQKQIQRNIQKTFNIKQTDRKKVISQLKLILGDGFPKIVIRTDISKFYESIPHKQLFEKIEESSLLSYPSKKIIKEVLNQYWRILLNDGIKNENDKRIGLPRGIGVSAILSELYLKDFDKLVKSMPNVTFYARYVDDMVIVITPNHREEKLTPRRYEAEVKKMMNKFNLEMNDSKTKVLDLRKSNTNRKNSIKYSLTFLGYNFEISYQMTWSDNKRSIQARPLVVCMSAKKKQRYIDKINAAFNDFNNEVVRFAGKESKVNNRLVQRIRFLTSNFRLFRRKDNILIGIYFSNEFLTGDLLDLKDLDNHLKTNINSALPKLSSITVNKLNKLSFKDGFNNKSTLNLNFNKKNKRGFVNIDKIIKIWANL